MTNPKIGELALRFQANFTHQLAIMREAEDLSNAERRELAEELLEIVTQNTELREMFASGTALDGVKYIMQTIHDEGISGDDAEPFPPFPEEDFVQTKQVLLENTGYRDTQPYVLYSSGITQPYVECFLCRKRFKDEEAMSEHTCKPYMAEIVDALQEIIVKLEEFDDTLRR